MNRFMRFITMAGGIAAFTYQQHILKEQWGLDKSEYWPIVALTIVFGLCAIAWSELVG